MMITKIQTIPSIVKLGRNFRDTLKSFDDDFNRRAYLHPVIGYYSKDVNKVRFIPLTPHMAKEAVRKGTIGMYDSLLKGHTRVVKLKCCVYIPHIRSSKEFAIIRNIEATSLQDFITKAKRKSLGVFDD